MGYDNEHAHQRHEAPFVVFDIETVPMPGCESYLDLMAIEAPSNYKDEKKIAAYIEDKKRRMVTEAGLDIDLCEIAAIAWEDEHERGGIVLRCTDDEPTMLRKFWAAVDGLPLVCFNGMHFDVPVLLRRSLYLEVSHPPIHLDRYRANGIHLIDLADVLSFGRRELLKSLDFYCKRFGIAHDDTVTGADMAAMVAACDWAGVSHHVYDDVAATKALALRTGVVSLPTVAPLPMGEL